MPSSASTATGSAASTACYAASLVTPACVIWVAEMERWSMAALWAKNIVDEGDQIRSVRSSSGCIWIARQVSILCPCRLLLSFSGRAILKAARAYEPPLDSTVRHPSCLATRTEAGVSSTRRLDRVQNGWRYHRLAPRPEPIRRETADRQHDLRRGSADWQSGSGRTPRAKVPAAEVPGGESGREDMG